jgi:hypothetical protein
MHGGMLLRMDIRETEQSHSSGLEGGGSVVDHFLFTRET